MDKRLSFSFTCSPEDVRKITLEYFTSQGFKIVEDNVKFLQFEKGSTLDNFFAFNPLSWKSKVTIEITEGKVQMLANISTIGQVVSKKEAELWDTFILNYKNSVDHNEPIVWENELATHDVYRSNKRIYFISSIGAILFGVPCFWLQFKYTINWLGFAGIFGGSMLFFLALVLWDKRK